MEKCAHCRFFDKAGRCRRREPTLRGWPKVTSKDWCGEFHPSDLKTKDDLHVMFMRDIAEQVGILREGRERRGQ